MRHRPTWRSQDNGAWFPHRSSNVPRRYVPPAQLPKVIDVADFRAILQSAVQRSHSALLAAPSFPCTRDPALATGQS
jgi:hypothetical protein